MQNLTYRQARDFTGNSLQAFGLSKADSTVVSEIFLRAHWQGQGHHDLSYLNQRLTWLEKGLVNPRAMPRVIMENQALCVLDGENCLGELGCTRALERALNLAATFGIGMATIRNSNHFLAGGPYGEIAAERGMVGIILSSTDKTMAGPSGGSAVIGNNPIAVGAPVGPTDFVLDMCMAYASLGTLNKQKQLGHFLEDHVGYDKNGNKTGDPGEILAGGSLAPIAHHKGFGLALMVEMLTGGINGGAMGLSIPEGGGIGGHSQTIIALNLQPFGGQAVFSERFTEMMDGFRQITPDIRHPGSRRSPWSEKCLDEVCVLSESTIADLKTWEKKLSIPLG